MKEYYGKIDLFLLCFSIQDKTSLEELRTIIKDIKQKHETGKYQFILVGTKNNEVSAAVMDSEVEAFKAQNGLGDTPYIKTSRTGASVDTLRGEIGKAFGIILPAMIGANQCGFFSSAKTKAAFTLGTLSATAVVGLLFMASASMISLNPIALGLLAVVATLSLTYTAVQARQNQEPSGPTLA